MIDNSCMTLSHYIQNTKYLAIGYLLLYAYENVDVEFCERSSNPVLIILYTLWYTDVR